VAHIKIDYMTYITV